MNSGEQDPVSAVVAAVRALEDGAFGPLLGLCDDVALAPIGGEQGLTACWRMQTYGIGAFERIESSECRGDTVLVRCRHSEWGLAVTVRMAEGRVTGLSFGHYRPEGMDPLPDGVVAREVAVDAGAGRPLGGTLYVSALSRGDAAVIVHGSGPMDRDGTVGPNTPYRDLAVGLAAKGVDVLTYDKRTLVYGPRSCDDPASITVDDETVDDAVAAVRSLRGMGYGRVFVIGHSLGGMMAPAIAERCGDDCCGIVSLAGSPRRISEIIADQMRSAAMGAPDPEGALRQAEGELAKAAALADMSDEQRRGIVVFGQPGRYVWSIDSSDPASAARALALPMMFVQGSADIQVDVVRDLGAWRDALDGAPNVRFAVYEGLNHLLMPSGGPFAGSPAEYLRRGRVDARVIDDVAGFILDG